MSSFAISICFNRPSRNAATRSGFSCPSFMASVSMRIAVFLLPASRAFSIGKTSYSTDGVTTVFSTAAVTAPPSPT